MNKALEIGKVGHIVGRKNYIINGSLDIWQRGTSQTSAGYGSADRFQFSHGAGTHYVTRQPVLPGDTGVPHGTRYYVNKNQSVAGAQHVVWHAIEGVRTLAGQKATFSFYARTGAPLTLYAQLYQAFGSGGSSPVITNSATFQTSTSWMRHEITFDVPSIAGKTIVEGIDALWIGIVFPPEIYNIDMTCLQMEEGSVATDFERRSIGEELALCQRYYQKYNQPCLRGVCNTSTSVNRMGMQLPVTMRTIPTIGFSGTINFYDGVTTAQLSVMGTGYSDENVLEFDANVSGNALTPGNPAILYQSGDTAYFYLSAEL